jgi:atypical dual specificity phosphatase
MSGVMRTARKIALATAACAALQVAAAACSPSPEMEGSAMQADFSWVLDRQLAGMPRPGAGFPLDQDVEFLSKKGIDLLVSLTETPTSSDALAAKDISLLHLPVPDFAAPGQEQLRQFVEAAAAVIDGGGRVGVHCAAGRGRTGTALAVYLVHTGMTATKAIERVRELRPGSIETAAQEQAVIDYYESVRR